MKRANNGNVQQQDADLLDQLPVHLHLSCDGYRPHKMNEGHEKGKAFFYLHQMVPPGELKYFFSVGNYTNEDLVKDFSTIPTLVNGTEPVTFAQNGANASDLVNVPKLNYIEGNVDINEQTLTIDDLSNWKAVARPKMLLAPVEEEETVAI